MFHNQLIELIGHEIGEPLAKFLHTAQVDVTGFTFDVLTVLAVSDGCIKLRSSVAGTDDWFF